jgi:hypothetical protein
MARPDASKKQFASIRAIRGYDFKTRIDKGREIAHKKQDS